MTRDLLVGCGGEPAAARDDLLRLLAPLDTSPRLTSPSRSSSSAPCALQRWVEWGAFDLTGRPGQVPVAPEAPVADRVSAAVALLADVTGGWGEAVALDPARLLTVRAAEAGFVRGGAVSANGSCLLLPSVDGWTAVNLARPDDVETVAALVGGPGADALRSALLRPGVRETLQTLEIPVSVLGEAADLAAITVQRLGGRGPVVRPLVLDLSAMWAGPLCAAILGRAGARVIKVEDPDRPDGARFGPAGFFADLHRGQELRALRLRDPAGRAALERLLGQADVVVESSRPRALRQLGVEAEGWIAARPGRTWISITGHGRTGPGADRVAFGDDAAVAGGLVAWDADGPVFCADAVADPLTGLYAGLAAAAGVAGGGGCVVDVAMAGVCAHVNRPGPSPRAHRVTIAPGGRRITRTGSAVPC